MLEIVFSDSACGSLKVAQHYGDGKFIKGCFGVIVSRKDGGKLTKKEMEAAQREAEEKERLAWESAVPMGGNPADIFGIGLALSIGSITEESFFAHRTEVLERLYSIYPRDVGNEAAQEIVQTAAKNVETVRRRIVAGETARIWYSSQPDEMCGMYWFLSQLKQWGANDAPVVAVELPEWEKPDGTVMQKSCWGEVSPGEWHRYLSYQKSLPVPLIQGYASRWKELQSENALLRAVLNGRLASVSEDLYDNLIRREIAAESDVFRETDIVGRLLGKYRLGIGDAWVALRIEKMIENGELEIASTVAEDMPIYHRTLKKLQ
ncbi:DUF1835 domain-containing protein [Oscillospiraceae bacterium HV4-5-C5C]|nr:DUF1835 domain-containing protein [Oscillospiraceae bacterium HV4-5-C5C]